MRIKLEYYSYLSGMRTMIKESALLRFFIFVFGIFTILHVLLWICVVPFRDVPKNIDTYSIHNPMGPIESTVWGRSALGEPGPHMVLIGASSTRNAFPVEQMASLFPGYRIQNFTVNGANLMHCAQILALLIDATPPENRKDAIFVVGLYFGSFNRDADGSWKISNPLENIPKMFYKPVRALMVYCMVLRDQWDKFVNYMHHRGASASAWEDALRMKYNDQTLTEADKRKFIVRSTPSVSPDVYFKDAFVLLQGMAQKAADAGIQLVLVDLPLAEWAQKNIPHDAVYQQKMAEFRPFLDQLGIPVVDMRFMNQEKFFFDWAHARPNAALVFSTYLADALRGQLLEK